MAVGLSALQSELLSDPVGIGYGSFIAQGNYGALTQLLNSISVNSGLEGVPSTIERSTVFALQMQQCVVASEYATLNAVQRDLWGTVITTALNGVSISNTVIRGQITAVWSVGLSGTRNNLLALQDRPASRCEVLFGENVTVSTDEISKAAQGDF